MAQQFNFFRVDVFPVAPVASSIYAVGSGLDVTKCTIVIVGTDPADVRQLDASPCDEILTHVAAPVTLASTSQTILVDSNGGAFTITLPPVSSGVKLDFYMANGHNPVTLVHDAADDMDIVVGTDSFTMDSKWDAVQLKAISGKWFIL